LADPIGPQGGNLLGPHGALTTTTHAIFGPAADSIRF